MQTIQLIDSHCHFDDPRLDPERDRLYREAVRAGVIAQIIPAVSRTGWERVACICSQYEGLHPCYGLHPYFVAEHSADDLDRLREWLDRHSAVAVGECGLDYFIPEPDRERQKFFFDGQLEIAADLDLPIVVHANRAVEDVILHIRRSRVRRGVIHSFNGSREQALQLIELGFKLGFGGAISYDRATRLRKLLSELPPDAILIETDAPDQPPASHRHELNVPARLKEIFTVFCELRAETPCELANQLNQNAVALFGLSV